jgi:septal ring factor EnvC (AmiA/AmiB activator)
MERKKPTRYLETKNAKMPKAGEPRLPIYGALVTNFGEIDDIGAKSRGLTLVPSNNTPVVAPMGGIIKFANSFKNYDKMIIIEHKNGYHSLIGGLSTIKTRIGRSVKAGEPIGNMIVSPSRKDKARLYYELRHKGKTINPATKFKHLKS